MCCIISIRYRSGGNSVGFSYVNSYLNSFIASMIVHVVSVLQISESGPTSSVDSMLL